MKKGWRWASCLVFLAMLTACAAGPRSSLHASPEILFEPPPAYPEAALASQVKGHVDLSVSVDEIGLPRAVRVVHEEPAGSGFGEAAAEALRGWIWRPAAMEGAPVEEAWNVTLLFDPVLTFGTRRLPMLLHQTKCEAAGEAPARAVVAADIDGEGNPDFLEVIAQDPAGEDLRDSAMRCVSTWRWMAGRPGQTYVVVEFGRRGDRGP